MKQDSKETKQYKDMGSYFELIEKYCLKDNLSTYDPYDIWKTKFGFRVKDFYNSHRLFGLFPAGTFTVFDMFINNNRRSFYSKQEYPIVRAMAALSLMNLYRIKREDNYLIYARKHVEWLASNYCSGYKGAGWGLHFNYAVSKNFHYDKNTPFSTMTPYCLEALLEYQNITGDTIYESLFAKVFTFFNEDLIVMDENEESMALSYVPKRDRVVVNASSYSMYAFAILLSHLTGDLKAQTVAKITKLYKYVQNNQRDDGAWFYSPVGKSFIDCFHTCIVLKNLIKANRIISLDGCSDIVHKGYEYILREFLDSKEYLFKRFSVSNKPGLVKYDLYDNAEVLNLAILMQDWDLVHKLSDSIEMKFIKNEIIYSQIDFLGVKRNPDMFRWAIMPYVYALSQIRFQEQ